MPRFTVTTLADGGAGSLRVVLAQTNATLAADSIVFAPGLEGGTLTLTRGELDLTSNVSIDGDRDNDGTEVTISGGDASCVLAISGSDTDAALVDLTIADGNTYAVNGLLSGGGGICADAGVRLTLQGCTLRDNGYPTTATAVPCSPLRAATSWSNGA